MPNPFAHVELNTDDVKKAKKFYQAVFAWKLNEMPEMGGYTMIDVGGGAGGGMQKKQMADAPTAWLPYVQVDDVKATMAKAIKAGAKPALEYQEIGEMGAIGVFIDPAGAVLGIWASKAPAAAPPPAKKAAVKKASPAAKAVEKPAKKTSAKAAPAPAKKASAKPAPTPAPAKKAAKAAPAPAKKSPSKKS